MAMRNYRAMNPDKLLKCHSEMVMQEGDAYERVVAKGEDYASHLNAITDAMTEKSILGASSARPVADDAGRQEPSYIPPQLAFDGNGSIDFVPEAQRDNWVMEPKFDGWRWQVHINEHEVRSIGGRNGKKHNGPPAVDAILTDALPVGTILDGEMMWQDGLSSSRVATFIAFDVLAVAGRDVCSRPWYERRRLLEVAMMNVPNGGCVGISPYGDVDDDTFYEWVGLGMEGAVLKRKDAPYRPGSRRRDGFVKIKPQQTTDAIVVGYEMGKGASNKDYAGALKIRLVETGAETSCGYHAKPKKAEALIGHYVEVAHYGWIRDSGKVRHPVFKRTRPDLEA
jgi:ATP-dependent DNA ligase